MKLKVVNGGAELQVSDAAFGQKFNEALVHQVVTAYRNAGRAGTKAQKTARRSARRRPQAAAAEGHGPGARRLDPQPDLGRRRPRLRREAARLRAEGQPQDVPRRACARCCRSWRARIACWSTDGITLEAPKTQAAARTSSRSWKLDSVLIVVEAHRREAVPRRAQPAARRSARGGALNPLSLAGYDKVLVTVGAVKLIEERLQ